MQIYDCDQGSEDWFRCRAGIPTASMFKTVMANGRAGGESKTRRSYMLRLAGEIITGEPAETFSNHHMERGRQLEGEARNYYAFLTDAEPQQIGFIRSGGKGCSPDSLIGDAGLLEIKTALPAILIDMILRDEFPPEHRAQVQGQLWIAEREWCDLQVYWPGLPAFIKRVMRDEPYIAELAAAVDQFNQELIRVVERINAYGQREAA
jgi:hypothetical protein